MIDKVKRSSVNVRIMFAVATVMVIAISGGTIGLSAFIKQKMTSNYVDSVSNLFSLLEEGVKGSLERGQMKNFKKLIQNQKNTKGVIDVSLFDKNGTLNMSSSGDASQQKELPANILSTLDSEKRHILQKNTDNIIIFSPQIVVPDCIRCHPSWQNGENGGFLSLTYDVSPLHQTTNQLLYFLAFGCLVTVLITCSVIAILMQRVITKPISAIIEELTQSTTMLSKNAYKSAEASTSLADHASSQAASLEETSAALEEISATTEQNAGNATTANTFMSEADQVMKESNLAMTQLTEAMEDINKANAETYKIIKTIDEIAFQTNLLALNAAVEAARAGEAGAGFAVVADEVRNLAMRAAQAAKDTATILEGNDARMKKGVNLVENTNKSFKNAAGKTSQTATILHEINTASKEQAIGIKEVTKAIQELDMLTQNNSGDAQQSSQVAGELESQSAQLRSHVATLTRLVKGEKGSSN